MKQVDQDVSFPELEQRILAFWKEEGIFQKSLDKKLPSTLSGEPRSEERADYILPSDIIE